LNVEQFNRLMKQIAKINSVYSSTSETLHQNVYRTFAATENLRSQLEKLQPFYVMSDPLRIEDFKLQLESLRQANAEYNHQQPNYEVFSIQQGLSVGMKVDFELIDAKNFRSVIDAASSAVEGVLPYLPEEEQAEYGGKIKTWVKNGLNSGNIAAWLSFILAVYCAIMTQISDKALEGYFERHNSIVQQQNELLDTAQQQSQALYEAIDSLGDAVVLLSDQIDLLNDRLQESEDSTDSDGELDDDNSLSEEANSEQEP